MEITPNLHKTFEGKSLLELLLNECRPGIEIIKILDRQRLYIDFIGYVNQFGECRYRFGYFNGAFSLTKWDNERRGGAIGEFCIWKKLIELGFKVK